VGADVEGSTTVELIMLSDEVATELTPAVGSAGMLLDALPLLYGAVETSTVGAAELVALAAGVVTGACSVVDSLALAVGPAVAVALAAVVPLL